MPLSLNFPSADAPAPALPVSGAPSLSGQPAGAADPVAASPRATFDNCLAAQADQSGPNSALSGKPASGHSAVVKKDRSKDDDSDSDETSSDKASSAPSVDQLTAMVGLVGVQQTPPPPPLAPNLPASDSTDASLLADGTSGAANAQTSTSSATLSKKQTRFFSGLNPAVQNAYAALQPNAASSDSSSGASSTENSGKVTPNTVAKNSLQNSAGASATTPTMIQAQAAVQDAVRQLLASGTPVIDYSFDADGKPVPSAPAAAVNSLVPAQLSPKAQGALNALSTPNGRSAKTSPATADFASLNASASATSGGVNTPQASEVDATSLTTSSQPSPVASPAAFPVPVVTTSLQTASETSAPANASASPSASDLVQAAGAAVVSGNPAGVVTSSTKGFNRANNTMGAKIAVGGARVASANTSGVKSSNSNTKNQFEKVDDEDVETSEDEVGTRGAKRVFSMPNNNPSSSAGARSSDPFAALAAASLNTDSASQAAEKTSPTALDVTSHAAQTVREIRDIADGLWAVERNSVEVRFNFSDSEKLSVRVEYRDGTVQATFRTDSPDLRDHLASAWQAQQAGAASESRPYRIADPVFGSGQSQDSNSSQAQDFSFGGSSSRQQQRSSEQSDSTPSPFSFARSAPSTTTIAPAAPRLLRPETTLHLNAFA